MGSPGALHLLKLSVGSSGVEDLDAWWERCAAEARAAGADPRPRHVTRMWPKRAGELLAGGSIYWVIGGVVLCRQRLLAFEPCDLGDGIARCALVLDRRLVRVAPQPRRPFQGWRYLSAADAPVDLATGAADLPPELEQALGALGVGGGARRCG